MEETWRWFGPDDTVTLEQIQQAGVSGILERDGAEDSYSDVIHALTAIRQ